MADRSCRICGKALSAYNPNDACFGHFEDARDGDGEAADALLDRAPRSSPRSRVNPPGPGRGRRQKPPSELRLADDPRAAKRYATRFDAQFTDDPPDPEPANS